MKVYTLSFTELPEHLPKSACCIGYFDGFHKGHQQLIEKTLETARRRSLLPGLITFDPDPWVLFAPASNLSHIMSMEDKIHMAQSLGMEVFYILQFSFAFAALSADEFHEVLQKMQVKELICGYDFRYGTKNSGDIHTLRDQKAFPVTVVEQISSQGEKISSTWIEKCLLSGDVQTAAWLLGQYYSIEGRIVHGYRRGSSLLQIPTANLKASDHYVLPADGVYFGYVLLEERMIPAMINIGKNPTFNNQKKTIEAHLLHFHENIYGKNVRFFFCRRLREGKKFATFQQLKDQLMEDREICSRLAQEENELLAGSRALWTKKFASD